MTREVPLVKPRLTAVLLGVSALALSACAEMVATPTEEISDAQPEAQPSKSNKKKTAPTKAAKAKDVPAPTAFAATDTAIWDGRPSLGAIWVAHPDAPQAERVEIVNKKTGKRVSGALFQRKKKAAGPPIQLSSDAALALGVGPGQTATLQITAIRPSNNVPPANDGAIQMARAPQEEKIWGEPAAKEEPEVADAELLIAAAEVAPAETKVTTFDADIPMGVFPEYDAALIVQARLSQAGVRSEIRETYLDEVIFYQVFAEQANTSTMIAEADVPAPEPDLQMADLGAMLPDYAKINLPDQQRKVTKGVNQLFAKHDLPESGPVGLRLSEAVVVAQLTAPDHAKPNETSLELQLPSAQRDLKTSQIQPLVVASVSEKEALKPFLSFETAVQYAANALELPQVFDQTGIAIPTKASPHLPETASVAELAKAHINFNTAPRPLAKGKPTEVLSELVGPKPPAQDQRAHVRTAYNSDGLTRDASPTSLAQAPIPDAPVARLERSEIKALAVLKPLARRETRETGIAKPSAQNRPKPHNRVASLGAINAQDIKPTRPASESNVRVLADFAPLAAPKALELSFSLGETGTTPLPSTPQTLTASLDFDALPFVQAQDRPIFELARATPRPRSKAKLKSTTSVVSLLDFNVNSIRDVTSLDLTKETGAGVAEVPNFRVLGTGLSGGDGGGWYDLNLLGTKN